MGSASPTSPWDSRTTRACVVPFSVLEGKSSLRLVFETPDAAAPRLFGQSDDDRSLAIAFTRLVLWPEAPGSDISEMEGNPAGDRVLNVDDVLEADRVPVSKLMLQFESLGQNCEFGLVQRHFKAEPLGIFRFSSTPLPQLLLALERRLEGLGEAGSVVVDISPNGQELMVKDKIFGFLYHAWVRTGEQTVEAVEQRERRRLPFLKRKLLDDLSLGEKVFVFHAMRRILEEEVFPLAAILRCFGPTTLLFVTLADEQHAVGTVELRAPGFMVGYLDRFAPANDAHAASYAEWANLCRQAYRLFRAGV